MPVLSRPPTVCKTTRLTLRGQLPRWPSAYDATGAQTTADARAAAQAVELLGAQEARLARIKPHGWLNPARCCERKNKCQSPVPVPWSLQSRLNAPRGPPPPSATVVHREGRQSR